MHGKKGCSARLLPDFLYTGLPQGFPEALFKGCLCTVRRGCSARLLLDFLQGHLKRASCTRYDWLTVHLFVYTVLDYFCVNSTLVCYFVFTDFVVLEGVGYTERLSPASAQRCIIRSTGQELGNVPTNLMHSFWFADDFLRPIVVVDSFTSLMSSSI